MAWNRKIMKEAIPISKDVQKAKLLIVDDNSNNRTAISWWLSEENYEILHAGDGPSAIKIAETFLPDIILLDYNLPGMDGIEVCQEIRAKKNLPFIPIIMMSSFTPEAGIVALEQGADEFIAMPIKSEELKSRLKAMLRLKEAVSQSVELSNENKKLQELDKIKSNFVSKVSHELRTPLQAVLGYTDILLEGLQGELNYPQKLMIKQIREGGEQLLNLITQLLDFEKVEKGEIAVCTETFNIQGVFHYLAQVMTPLALKKKITLSFVLAKDDIRLESDKNIVQKILLNIVSNSIKFSKENSKIIISVQEHGNDFTSFKIQDEGIGIPKSNLAYIFDKFWQGDDSITRSYGGLGIGLTLAKRLTTLLGGQIKVESKVNQGSVFTVVLPKEYKQFSQNVSERMLEEAV